MINIYSSTQKNGRDTNQDRYACIKLALPDGGNLWCAAIADGMGGLSDGGAYAELALCAMQRYAAEVVFRVGQQKQSGESGSFKELAVRYIESSAKELMERINREVIAQAEIQGLQHGGATLSACFVIEDTVLCLNVGDSPVYHKSQSGISELSIRDNAAEEGVRTGEYQRNSDAYRKDSSHLLSFIGKKSGEAVTHCGKAILMPGDVILLGSDGAFGYMSCAEFLAPKLDSIPSPAAYCAGIMREATESTWDNQTLIVIEYYTEEKKQKKGLFSFGR